MSLDYVQGDVYYNLLTSRLEEHNQGYSRSLSEDGEPIWNEPDSRYAAPSRSKDVPGVFSRTAINFVNLITENVIVHPFLVFRRQCQVARFAERYHLTPFTVIPLMAKTQLRQGFGSLWKGWVSNLLVKGLFLSCKSIITTNIETSQGLIVGSLAIILVTPFLASSAADTVQSSISSDDQGVIQFLQGGLSRFSFYSHVGSRILPFFTIAWPTLGYFVLHYSISSSFQSLYTWKSYYEEEKEDKDNDPGYRQTMGRLYGEILAEIILYPFQTVIIRLYLQGMRIISDNVDTGTTVYPVITNFEGFKDCFQSLVREETMWGGYKGFGCLILQYSVQIAMLRFTKSMIRRICQDV